MASGMYNIQKADWMNKEVDMEADVYKVMLLDSSHTFTATDNTKSQIVANEISGTGYTAGGETLANKTVTQAATTKFDADDVVWTAATFTARHAVIYNDTTASDNLSVSIDFGGDQTVAAADFTIAWHSSGIITIA